MFASLVSCLLPLRLQHWGPARDSQAGEAESGEAGWVRQGRCKDAGPALQLGRAMKAEWGSTTQIGFAHRLTVLAQQY